MSIWLYDFSVHAEALDKHKKHNTRVRKTVKIAASVVLLYILSFSPQILAAFKVITDIDLAYTLFANHIGNVIVYFIIDASFRKHVKKLYQMARGG